MSEQQDWVRQQLADLPEVPMPPEVRERLAVAIRAQAEADAPGGTAEVPLARDGATGANPPAETLAAAPDNSASGPRRWWIGVAGAAAAVAALALVNPLGLGGGGSGGGVAAEAEANSVASPLDTGAESDDAPAEGGQRPSSLQIQQASLASPMSYSAGSLGDRMRSFLTGSGGTGDGSEESSPTVGQAPAAADPSGLPESWRDASGLPAATPEGLVDCVRALPWDGELLLLVERAAYDADPAIIVVRQGAARWEVLVQHYSCSAGNPYVLYRDTVER